ncbi:hypothetical protein BI364_13135 [Acidihalobacter yilgarnensis]|uniref:Uncharacterized protein n=1 Tax=Acidihalobacter yilgarnensis TaxID=2819280 RepID=A0A1D8IQN2_9GAMM|nr:hypothetical protein [Acidihalobacter yilgarnensis]AOU98782.1 hypothetical protein BI364_13135 [Acidihalobacter yilgarnensis]
MSGEKVLSYPRNVTYNFSQWNAEEAVSLNIDGVRHFGILKGEHGHSPYRVVLSEVFEHGASRRIAPRIIEVSDLGEVTFLHQHGH